MRYLFFVFYLVAMLGLAFLLSCHDQPTMQELRRDLYAGEEVPAALSKQTLLYMKNSELVLFVGGAGSSIPVSGRFHSKT